MFDTSLILLSVFRINHCTRWFRRLYNDMLQVSSIERGTLVGT